MLFQNLPEGQRNDWLSDPATKAYMNQLAELRAIMQSEIIRLAVGGPVEELRFRAGIHEGLGRALRTAEDK
jgi:hypothetical protein